MEYPLDFIHPETKLSALSYGALTNSIECLNYMLKFDCMTTLINLQSNKGYSPLHYAVRMASLETTELFIMYGA